VRSRFRSVVSPLLVFIIVLSTVTPVGAQEDASLTPWDAVAHCESTNNYQINTGNSFYGGIQFTIGTWNWVAGKVRPDLVGVRPDLASKHDQLVMADALAFDVAGGGLSHWPVCGLQYDHSMPRYNGEAPKAPAQNHPIGYLDRVMPIVDVDDPGYNPRYPRHKLLMLGWAYDADCPSCQINVHFYTGIIPLRSPVTTASRERPDVNGVMGVPGDHGFTHLTWPADVQTDPRPIRVPGVTNVLFCAYAIGVDSNGIPDNDNRLLGCKRI